MVLVHALSLKLLEEQVLTYTQQSKELVKTEQDKLEKRIQEFRTQSDLANFRSSSNMEATTSGDGIHVIGFNSYKNIEALMQSTANGQVIVLSLCNFWIGKKDDLNVCLMVRT